MEVSITPLADASSGSAGASFAGGVKNAQIALTDDTNTVSFQLVPSFSPGLSAPINYRVLWRAGVMSRTFTYDFSMPDADLFFDQLATLGDIIDGQTYLQQSDLGIPGRVARLNDMGQVVDSAGNPVASSSDLTVATNALNAEKVARQAADAAQAATLGAEINTQVSATLNTAQIYTNNQITSVHSDVAAERTQRQNADADLQNQINTNVDTVTALATAITTTVSGHTAQLLLKADLDGTGHLAVAQIPDAAITNAVTVPDQASMLALSTTSVHKGTLAVRPDGAFLLQAANPTVLGNWLPLSAVTSVNGKRGVVVLSPADVGAIPVGGTITQSQVTGLVTALGTKANTTDLATTNATLISIQNDPTTVHTSGGVIPSSLLDANMVYLNPSGQLTKKDGTIIAISGGGGSVFSVNSKTGLVVLTATDVGAIPLGGAITQAQVTGLTTALGSKADLVGGYVPVGQLPNFPTTQVTGLSTALAGKADLVAGSVPLGQVPTLPQSQITGLGALIAGNQLSSTSNAINRISTLEGQVVGGGGGGSGVGSTVPFYTSANTTTAVVDFTQVNLHSPWGVDSDGTVTGGIGTWYYLYSGVRSTDVAYPYISDNGHLSLRRWNEAGPADPSYALASDLATLTSTVGTKADTSTVSALSTTVSTKANQSDLTALSTTVDGKASIADLNATNTAVAARALASDLATTNATLATKANQSDLSTLATTVGAKANQSDLTTANTNIATLTSALSSKADLVSAKVPLAQLPSLPESQVTNLVTDLAAKADLSGGKLATGQIPTNIPQSSVTGLGTTLGNKADLVAGVIPLAQVPMGALPNVQVVANRAAMLALTTAQVQYGDLALITSTADKGTWVLTGSDPTQFVNWTLLTTPDAPVTSVNGDTGTVVLTATDVGALGSSAPIPQSQITGLVTALSTFATSSALTSGLAGKTSPADVQSMFFLSSMVKRADYVSAGAVASLAGQQSVDGVLVPLAAIVLLTNQSSSVSNGLWTVNSGAWTRPADFATSSFLARDSVVVINNATAGANGTTNPNTIWQMSVSSGFIDSNANNWTRIGWSAPPFSPTAGNGITVTGSTFAANVLTGGGVNSGSSGLSVDANVVVKKFLGTVPSGSTVAGITHNLNTTSPVVSIYDTASGVLVLAGVTITTANAISIEFASAPASGQYRVVVHG